MATKTSDDPILKLFRSALDEIYGDQLERAVLFGSRARGDAQTDSDYDIAVFLTAVRDRWAEMNRLADLRITFLDDTGVFFDAKPYPVEAYRDNSPLMFEIRKDGLDF